MPEGQPRGPTCRATQSRRTNDSDTLCVQASDRPGITGNTDSSGQAWYYSSTVTTSVNVAFNISPHMTWDAFWRQAYDRIAEGLAEQAKELLKRGNVTNAEVEALVNSRNSELLRIRNRLSPLGELYSEILKPRGSLKNLSQFLHEKGTLEAVLRSVGKTRAVVDRLSIVCRVAGPTLIVLDVGLSAVAIAQTPPDARGRVTAREAGRMALGAGGGALGAWAGCASFAAFASPSLVLPVIGEVTTGGACLVGGILGGLGAGYLSSELGKEAGVVIYDWTSELTWD